MINAFVTTKIGQRIATKLLTAVQRRYQTRRPGKLKTWKKDNASFYEMIYSQETYVVSDDKTPAISTLYFSLETNELLGQSVRWPNKEMLFYMDKK